MERNGVKWTCEVRRRKTEISRQCGPTATLRRKAPPSTAEPKEALHASQPEALDLSMLQDPSLKHMVAIFIKHGIVETSGSTECRFEKKERRKKAG